MDESRMDTLEKRFDQFDEIRKDLLLSKDQHVKILTDAGLSNLEALKDWRDNFTRILDSMDINTREIRKLVLNN
jgi:hypothetical protein